MNRTVLRITTTKSKNNGRFVINREHVEYTDGTTEDRTVCYSYEGQFLGGIKEAEKRLAEIASEYRRTVESRPTKLKRVYKNEPK